MPDWSTVLTSVTSAFGVTLAGGYWLTQKLVENRLGKDLALYKATLDRELADAKGALDADLIVKKSALDAEATKAKALLDAELRRNVDEYLGEKAAERQYRLDARKRLYVAIGPLRFQLVTAAGEVANRIANIGLGTQDYELHIRGYFGRSTAFRVLRLLAVAELIERQIAHADFSVDPATTSLLRFKTAAFRSLSSSSVSLGHPREDWDNQVEHVFHDGLSMIVAVMIVSDAPGTQRVMRFNEFSAFVSAPDSVRQLQPLPRLLDGLKPVSKPLLWLRLVALADLCAAFVLREGTAVGITPEPLDTRSLLMATRDAHIVGNMDRYIQAIDALADQVFVQPQSAACG